MFSYTENDPVNAIDPMGLIKFEYTTELIKFPHSFLSWHNGETQPHFKPSGECVKQCDNKWKLEIKLIVNFTIKYDTEETLKHEYGHVEIAKAFFERMKPQYEKAERIFGTQSECEMYKFVNASDDLKKEMKQGWKEFKYMQNTHDAFWGWLRNRLGI
jgi:hypothetical protein